MILTVEFLGNYNYTFFLDLLMNLLFIIYTEL